MKRRYQITTPGGNTLIVIGSDIPSETIDALIWVGELIVDQLGLDVRAIELKSSPPPIPEGMKRCGICKQIKDIEQFTKDSTRHDGRRYHCKDCWPKRIRPSRAAEQRAWRAANPEKAAQYRKTYAKKRKALSPATQEGVRHDLPRVSHEAKR